MHKIVLEEELALRRPSVAGGNERWFMSASGALAGDVLLYEALEFPFSWRRVPEVLGGVFHSAHILCWKASYYLAVSEQNPHAPNQTQSLLFYASDATGPWVEHPASGTNTMPPAPVSFLTAGATLLMRTGGCGGRVHKVSLDPDVLEISDRAVDISALLGISSDSLPHGDIVGMAVIERASGLRVSAVEVRGLETCNDASNREHSSRDASMRRTKPEMEKCLDVSEAFEGFRSPAPWYDAANMSRVSPMWVAWRSVRFDKNPVAWAGDWRGWRRYIADLVSVAPLSEGMALFESGCGVGTTLEIVHLLHPTVELAGADLYTDIIRSVRQVLPQFRLCQMPEDASLQRWREASFDVALSVGVLGLAEQEHVKALLWIVKPGGVVLLDCRWQFNFSFATKAFWADFQPLLKGFHLLRSPHNHPGTYIARLVKREEGHQTCASQQTETNSDAGLGCGNVVDRFFEAMRVDAFTSETGFPSVEEFHSKYALQLHSRT